MEMKELIVAVIVGDFDKGINRPANIPFTIKEKVLMVMGEVDGKLHILEVDPWTRTPILDYIGTFAVPLLMYVLIKTHIEGLPRHISDK